MDQTERLWEGRLLAPVTAESVGELLGLCELRRPDVFPDAPFEPDVPYLDPSEIEALELLATRGTMTAAELIDVLGGTEGGYWMFRAMLQKFHYAVTWPDHPDADRPMRIEGRMLPGLPQALWDEAAERTHEVRGPAVDIVGTLIEVIPLDAPTRVVPLIHKFVGVPLRRFPSYSEQLTGYWAQWVDTNRALCATAYADFV